MLVVGGLIVKSYDFKNELLFSVKIHWLRVTE